jgi:uncharacterized protein YbjT (DUF2867 family)
MFIIDWHHGGAGRMVPSSEGERETMYAILGASGNTGSIVAKELLAAGEKVRVVVRDASKVSALAAAGAEVVVGSVDDVATLTRAFTGAKGAYVLMPPDMKSTDLPAENRRRAQAIRDALVAAKVPHVVLLSSIGAHLPAGTGPIATLHVAEKLLGTIPGTKLTAIRAGYFYENTAGLLQPMKTDGVLPAFSTNLDVPIPMVATRDIGAVAARALREPPAASEAILLFGPRLESYGDVARAFGAALGRHVKAVSAPFDAVEPTFMGHGASAHVARLYREMVEGFDAGRIVPEGTERRVNGAIDAAAFARSVVG